MVTERPTETTNSTVPAANPPNKIPAISARAFTGGALRPIIGERRVAVSATRCFTVSQTPLLLRRAGTDRQHLTLVFHVPHRHQNLLVKLAVRPLHDLVQILVHDDVASLRIDLDRALRAVELPAFQRLHGRSAIVDLTFGGMNGVIDCGHAVPGADRGEVRGRVRAVSLLPRSDESLVLRVIEIGVVMMHGNESDCRVAHALEQLVWDDIAGADQLGPRCAHAERIISLDDRG